MALRFLLKYRTYTFLNIAGLTAGLYCSLLIILWIDRNVSMDRFHAKGKNIYKLYKEGRFSEGKLMTIPSLPGPLAPALIREVPEIKDAVRVTWTKRLQFTRGEKSFFEYGFYADSSFFELFSFNLFRGNASTVLDDPGSVAISEKIALKYFGKNDVVGETIIISNGELCTVTGVFRDVPVYSSINFDFILPFSKYYKQNKSFMDRWDNSDLSTYILITSGADLKKLSDKMSGVIGEHYEDANKYKIRIVGQPLEQMYLYSDFNSSSRKPSGVIGRVRIMSVVAVFIVLLACFNYINMATALSIKRSRETGLKMIFGSERKSLIFQFIIESISLTIFAFIISWLLVRLSLPLINRVLNENLRDEIKDPLIKAVIYLLPVFTGTVAGLIPALKLSSLKPIAAMTNNPGKGTGKATLRYFLIVFQFIITISFIFFSITIFRQLKFLREKDLGMNKENVIFFKPAESMLVQHASFKDELKSLPGVEDVTYIFNNPLNINSYLQCSGKDPEKEFSVAYMVADPDFTRTMGIEIVEGADSRTGYTDENKSVLINQEMAKSLGYENPVGQVVKFMGQSATISGVVKNFHFNSLRVPVRQLMVFLGYEGTDMILVRIKDDRKEETISSIENKFHDFESGIPFEYSFMDDLLENYYRNDHSMEMLSDLFTIIAVIISCTGLFGLALFTTEQRTKEIGIRKTFGSGSAEILILLISSFLKWIMISFIISGLISFYVLDKWLQGFAYHAYLNVGIFIIAGILIMILALATISWKCWNASNSNPLDSLKYE